MNSFHSINKLIVFISLLSLASCTEDVPTVGIGDGGVEIIDGRNLSQIPTDQGSLGLTLNLRNLVKKGYEPTTVDIDVKATSGDFSKSGIAVDPFTYIVNHSEESESLTQAQRTELSEGVDIIITLRDKANQVIETKTYTKRTFAPSPEELDIDGADLVDITPSVILRSDVPHYVQFYDREKEVIAGGLDNTNWIASGANDQSRRVLNKSIDNINYDDDRSTLYHFHPIEGKPGVYSISYHSGGDIHYLYYRGDILYIQTRRNLQLNGGNTDVSPLLSYQFEIKKEGLGIYSIYPLSESANGPLQLSSENFFNAGGRDGLAFRILSFDIDWEIQSIDTRFSDPILPSNETSSAFNSTLKNCSSGELVQTVGTSASQESRRETGWDESISISNSTSNTLSLTISAEVETKFFGKRGKIGISASGSHTWSEEETKTNSKWESVTTTESVTLSTERTITVPSKRATQVTDLYQTYSNVRIPFVQRFRVRGTLEGNVLTGEEIMSQFHFNGFNGIVSEVGSDYIEVNVKGFTKVDKLIDTETSAEDVQTSCG